MSGLVELLSAIAQFSFLGFIGICAWYYTHRHSHYDLPRYRIRAENIRLHGWPPPHLDADGDFRPVADDEEEDDPPPSPTKG